VDALANCYQARQRFIKSRCARPKLSGDSQRLRPFVGGEVVRAFQCDIEHWLESAVENVVAGLVGEIAHEHG
jgi:hypothetical protein